jgi:hypothetical protein
LHLLDKLQLASFRVENTSLMPGDYQQKLTDRELGDLVAYLGARRERTVEVGAADPASAGILRGGVTFDRLVQAGAEPHNWLMTGATIRARIIRRSIRSASNAASLQTAWTFRCQVTRCSRPPRLSSTGSCTTQPGVSSLWSAEWAAAVAIFPTSEGPQPFEINPYNRGVAILGRSACS